MQQYLSKTCKYLIYSSACTVTITITLNCVLISVPLHGRIVVWDKQF